MIDYFGNRFFRRPPPLVDKKTVADFIDGNCAFVVQSALYGYIKTRAGFQYFRLFDDEKFSASVNIAKWNIYAVAVGDLTLFCGAHLRKKVKAAPLADFMRECVADVFAKHGDPSDAGADYSRLKKETTARICRAQWTGLDDNEKAFSDSPAALVYWAPVDDEHKKYDARIVQNSIVFKWKEVRDKFRRQVDWPALEKEISRRG